MCKGMRSNSATGQPLLCVRRFAYETEIQEGSSRIVERGSTDFCLLENQVLCCYDLDGRSHTPCGHNHRAWSGEKTEGLHNDALILHTYVDELHSRPRATIKS